MVATSLWLALSRTSLLSLLAAASLFGCSSNPDLPPLAKGTVTRINPTNEGIANPQPCADGDSRSCSKTLSQQGSVLTCYYGTETCTGGVWSDCGQGTVVLQSAPPSGNRQIAAISTPQPCGLDNLCDPSCQKYVELPNAGLTAQVNANTAWLTGSLTSLPPAVQSIVSKTPCQTAADCQQNQHCVNVATDATCAPHDKCQVGQTMGGTCNDSCVANICAQLPSCCQSNGQTSCNPGDTLSADGSRCYHQETRSLGWFDARAACKQLPGTGWDLICIGTQADENIIKGRNNTDSWTGLKRVVDNVTQSPFACVNLEHTLNNGSPSGSPWDSGEPNNSGGENCAEIYAGSGLWNDEDCATTLPSWCERPAIGAGSWSADCVNAVASVCDATCGTNQTGSCVAWQPGEQESYPNSQNHFDLGLGTPCNGQITVCNHGTTTAPANIPVYVLPVGQFGSPTVNTAGLTPCTTGAAINAGSCLTIPDCTNTLARQSAALWVTAPVGYQDFNVTDNWGYSNPNVACGAAQCLSAAGAGPCFASKTQPFDYAGLCPNSDQIPQWSFLTFDSVTPGDSSIVFTAQAAPTGDQLATEPAVSLATVTHAAGNEQCNLSGPASKSCPIDLYTALLPRGNANSAVLRLTISINPTSDGTQSPILNNWRISYSCPAGI
jgi:hypothetical protein